MQSLCPEYEQEINPTVRESSVQANENEILALAAMLDKLDIAACSTNVMPSK
jgi:hypothetical protein